MFTHQHLAELLDAPDGPAVSMFLPTHQGGRETRQDPIRLRNLVAQAERQLREEHGLREADATELVAPAHACLEDEIFMRHLDSGLAIFMAPNFSRIFRVPLELPEHVEVGERFHVKPLLPVLARDGRFTILTLGLGEPQLFEASRFNIRQVPTPELPEGLRSVIERTVLPGNVGGHPTGPKPTTGGAPNVRRHAAGEAPEDYRHVMTEQYSVDLAKVLGELLGGRHEPLVLVGEPRLQSMLRRHLSYPYLCEAGVEINPTSLDEKELHRKAYEIVRPLFDRSREEALAGFEARAGDAADDRATSEIERILTDAIDGRVDTLLVALDTADWGSFDAESRKLDRHAERRQGDEDLHDRAVMETLCHGGAVFAVSSSDQIPAPSGIAALRRY